MHACLHGSGRLSVPKLFDKSVAGYHLARPKRQQGEERTLLSTPQRKRPVALDDFKRAEKPDFHASIEQRCKKVASGSGDAVTSSATGGANAEFRHGQQ
jgi:hypothetical protein